MNGNHAITSQNKKLTINFIYIFKSLLFNLESRSNTRNNGSIIWDKGPLPSHYKSFNIITSKALQQCNCWATRKWKVWSYQIQVGWIWSRIGGCCIHIRFQSSSFDCDNQIWTPCNHWSKGYHPVIFIYHTRHGRLTPWNPVGGKLSSIFGAPPRRKLWSRTISPTRANNNRATAP